MDLGMNRLRDSEIKFRAYDDTLRRMMKPLTLEEIFKGNFGCTNLYQLTLMQYTGLKDANGTEIYEGDVLVAYWDDIHVREKTVVRWNDNGQWSISKNRIASRGHIVVGNIYEGVDGKPWQ